MSLRESSVYVGAPGISYAFIRLSSISPDLLKAIDSSQLWLLEAAKNLLLEADNKSIGACDDPCSLMFGKAGRYAT
jgi:hypothetical protein